MEVARTALGTRLLMAVTRTGCASPEAVARAQARLGRVSRHTHTGCSSDNRSLYWFRYRAARKLASARRAAPTGSALGLQARQSGGGCRHSPLSAASPASAGPSMEVASPLQGALSPPESRCPGQPRPETAVEANQAAACCC